MPREDRISDKLRARCAGTGPEPAGEEGRLVSVNTHVQPAGAGTHGRGPTATSAHSFRYQTRSQGTREGAGSHLPVLRERLLGEGLENLPPGGACTVHIAEGFFHH